ncbi:MAG TPA: hypothetical protein VHL10_04460, partial [Nitrososphaera sp.]|nr:hypothetical protein [Nitrososphaera sp.]
MAQDAELLAGMVLTPIYKNPEQGVAALNKVMQGANDPAAGLAHAIFGMMSQARNMVKKADLPINPKAWLA